MSAPPPDRLSFLTDRPFAHRGLHGAGVSENGMTAFQAAVDNGFGIECDVRASRDGVAIVFHDATLSRMTGIEGAVGDRTMEALGAMALSDGSPIPRLSALLDLVGTDVPLLIELKVKGRHVAPLCAAVERELLRRQSAHAAVMSFNPLAMRWFARHQPAIVRGLVVTEQDEPGWRGAVRRALALWIARPDFIACDIRDLPSCLSRRARLRGLPVLTWTVRSDADRARAAAHADQIIFERPHG